MSLRKFVHQVRPIEETYIAPMNKVHNFLTDAVTKLPQEEKLDIDSLVSAEDATTATQMYETAAVMVAMGGLKLTKSKFKSIMSHKQFSPTAKEWINNFLNIHSNEEALNSLLSWFVFIGGAVVNIHGGKFKDFIHKTVDSEYKAKAPTTFQVVTANKPNTADVVLITSGKKEDVFSYFKTISSLPDEQQSSRINTTKDGLVTLLDEKGKEIVSFFQISLKKGTDTARIGRATTFINKNYAGGASLGSPTQAFDVSQSLQSEGFFGDAISKFKDVISGGFKNFVGWVKGKYIKVAQVIAGVSVKLSNQIIKKNRGMKSISNILNVTQLGESSLQLEVKKSPNIVVTKTLLKEFKTIESEFIKKDEINKSHKRNMALLEKLNSAYGVPNRKVLPILMLPNSNAGIVNMSEISNSISKVLKSKEGDIITKSDIFVALKIGMNYSANIAIFAILKSIERNISQYENLDQALFAFSAEIESEVKFGNTSIPLVIVYGGENRKSLVLGTRSDYKQDKTVELSQTGKKYDDFPVAIISVRKAKSRKIEQLYNVIHFKIVTDFKDVGGKPEPIYLMFELIADQSRSFTLKVEGNKYQDKIKAMA